MDAEQLAPLAPAAPSPDDLAKLADKLYDLQDRGLFARVDHRKLHSSDDTREAIRIAAQAAYRRSKSKLGRATRRFLYWHFRLVT